MGLRTDMSGFEDHSGWEREIPIASSGACRSFISQWIECSISNQNYPGFAVHWLKGLFFFSV